MLKTKLAASAAIMSLFFGNSVLAESNKDIDVLRAEIQNMKQVYEKRIADMEAKLGKVEKKQSDSNYILQATKSLPFNRKGHLPNIISSPF